MRDPVSKRGEPRKQHPRFLTHVHIHAYMHPASSHVCTHMPKARLLMHVHTHADTQAGRGKAGKREEGVWFPTKLLTEGGHIGVSG